ncbi:hypothetical protein EKO23_22230 [Nocardioides guangzhouensis]|uniref:Uncharacterized protein n=1 Tax=Nocardioides guangzhouensis TaxID=2497878 RepID=A0A4Q4Z3E5_9ACTN|nr:hypothetical protein [Nocardioides guangzhouensis]RYP82197.1 hypothetical protein EKO23_22230 [Nocardioides guangzhouensis]
MKHVEHEDPATGRGIGAGVLFFGAIFMLVAASPSRLGRTARGALELKDTAETAYAMWTYRIILPIFVPLVALVAGLFVTMSFEELLERRWGQWLLGFLAGVVAFAVAGYLAWFWWGLVT